MTRYDEVVAALPSLPPPAAARFAAACATRARPLVVAFGAPETVTVYDEAVDRLWRVDGTDLEGAITAIESAPEAQEDDSHLSSYEVMRALGVPAQGLELLRPEPPVEAAEWVAGAAADISAGLDVYLDGTSALEEAELADQLDQAQRLADPTVDVASVRADAERGAARVASALPEVARRQGWMLNGEQP